MVFFCLQKFFLCPGFGLPQKTGMVQLQVEEESVLLSTVTPSSRSRVTSVFVTIVSTGHQPPPCGFVEVSELGVFWGSLSLEKRKHQGAFTLVLPCCFPSHVLTSLSSLTRRKTAALRYHCQQLLPVQRFFQYSAVPRGWSCPGSTL